MTDSLPKPVGYTSEMSLDRGEGIFVADAADQYFKTPLFTAEQVVALMQEAARDGWKGSGPESGHDPHATLEAFRAAYCKAKP